ncbi:MAG: selenocysteine-specific translation elongation factor [Burkholderiaceae bacterium]|nr:selenocysteine-specific translation elongation factor [Burkholderiaceae bacterium]
MIVGTAGHIDHGKTTLVRALTGVDTDRLPEEKARGVSIELGYAFMDAPGGGRIGFIDVPGHERLVHTMLGGATGIDHALLLVAADDGPMPQTHEHLAVLSLLGLTQGTVVVTKADRVEPARAQAVAAEAAALLEGTPLTGSPVFTVSATTGEGMAALRAHLLAEAASVGAHPAADRAFRLAVDRAFTLGGVGTVVTGTVHAGAVAVGDELRLVPGDRRLRVRSLHAQNQPVQRAEAGQRCAVALAGIEKGEIERGQWLVAPPVALATDRLDATLTLWPHEARALRSGTPVHVHIGALATTGTVAMLSPEVLAPGASGVVQIVLRSPLAAWHGDRVVLRDAAASRTLAGGLVLDPFAPARYRRAPARLAELAALQADDAGARLQGLLAIAPNGLDLQRLAAAQGVAALPAPPADVLLQSDAQGHWALGALQAQAAGDRLLAVLDQFHARHPDELGPDAARLRRLALPRLPEPLWRALLARAQADGDVAVRGAFVHRPAHGVRLSATEERIAQKLAPALEAAGFEGAWVRDLARDHGEGEPLMRVTLARLAQRGELHQVVKDLYYPVPTMRRLVGIARDVGAQAAGEVTAAAFRDATGLGRKRAIQILEYFDRVGLLRRVGDVHRVRADSAWLAEAA